MNKKGKETEKITKEATKESTAVKETTKKEQKTDNNNNGTKIPTEKSEQVQNNNPEKNIPSNEKNSQRNSTLNNEKPNSNTNQTLPNETNNKSDKDIKTEKSRTSVATNKIENANIKPEGMKNKSSPTNLVQSEKKKSKQPDNNENILPLSKRQEQVKDFDSYIEDSGIPVAFQLIYSEIISKGITPENFFSYTALRLRQIGKEIEEIKNGDKN